MDNDPAAILRLLGEITDMVPESIARSNPFLLHLPRLLVQQKFQNMNLVKIRDFTRLAIGKSGHPVVGDALKVLNRLVNPEDGSLKKPAPDIFYENYYFRWNELGKNTTAPDVIMHVLNKTLFVISMGQS